MYLQPENCLSPGAFHFQKGIAEWSWKGESDVLETVMTSIEGIITQTKVLSLEVEITEEIQTPEWSREDIGSD